MNKERPNKKERGITLIALVITIVLMVILASVAIRGVTGSESLITAAEVAAEDFNIKSYKEQIEEKVRGIVVAKSALRKQITLETIAEELKEETLLLKKAEATIGSEKTNDDIIVETTDGYIFQVYYDSIYGTIQVEYCGKSRGGNIPNLRAIYNEVTGNIKTTASIDKGEIKKIDIIYKGEIKKTITEGLDKEIEINVKEYGTGWYIVRTASNEGKLRHAWIRVSNVTDSLKIPMIEFEPINPNGKNGWYTSKVKVTITSPEKDNPYAKEIRYELSGGVTQNEKVESKVAGEKVEFEINASGPTIITARTGDGQGNVSEEYTREAQVDIDKPEIEEIKVEADGGETGWGNVVEGKTEKWLITNRKNNNQRKRRQRKSEYKDTVTK